jgi:hypothetical protein
MAVLVVCGSTGHPEPPAAFSTDRRTTKVIGVSALVVV